MEWDDLGCSPNHDKKVWDDFGCCNKEKKINPEGQLKWIKQRKKKGPLGPEDGKKEKKMQLSQAAEATFNAIQLIQTYGQSYTLLSK